MIDFQRDDRLFDLYDAATQQKKDALESLCPSFMELRDETNRYEEQSLLGRGGLKEVFRALDRHTQSPVALARLRLDRGLQYYDLFVREARLVASLNHPNIIKIHDAGVGEDQRPYFTMDLKGNTTLLDLIQRATPRNELLEIFQKVCDAIAYAHSRGIIHLDLKPENIQCDEYGEVLVCDWGLAKALCGSGDDIEVLSMPSVAAYTMMGQFKGSLGYMAPEQASGDELGLRTDIYALGCLLHTILCGEPPFSGSAETVLKKTATCAVQGLRTRFPARSISASMEAVAMKATALRPADRYNSVMELRQEIHNFLRGYSTAAEESGFFKEAKLFIARNRIPSTITLASLVVVTILSVLFVQRLGQQQMATTEERNRANRLLEQVTELSSEYRVLTEQSVVSKKELARQLVAAADSMKYIGIYYRPIETIDESMALVEMALQLDPECGPARWNRFLLNCLTLNYAAAISDIQFAGEDQPYTQHDLVHAFPLYNFDATHRPTTEQLIDLFLYKTGATEKNAGYIERAFIYHAATVSDRTDLHAALNALLVRLNGGQQHFTMEYDPETGALAMVSDKNNIMLRAKTGKFSTSLLRFIPVQSLKVTVPGRFTLKDIDNLALESLDISACGNVPLDKFIELPQLTTLWMRPSQLPVEPLRSRIRSNKPFQIIEVNSPASPRDASNRVPLEKPTVYSPVL